MTERCFILTEVFPGIQSVYRHGERVYSCSLDEGITNRIIQDLLEINPETEITVASGRKVFWNSLYISESEKLHKAVYHDYQKPLSCRANKIVAELSDSETTVHVGGLDNVDASVFAGFDYTALGHIHKPQQVGGHPIWYAGSPLKYSFGETGQDKCALLVTLGAEGLSEVKPILLRPMREMRKVSGSLKELLDQGSGERREDYIQAILSDQGELIDPIGTLRSVYPNIMQILRKTKEQEGEREAFETSVSRQLLKKRDGLSLFEDFYREVRGEELTLEEKEFMGNLVKELEGAGI